jgi:ribosomal protein S3
MGQKVNPISMRLQANKDWRSKWFVGKREYASTLSTTTWKSVRKLIQEQAW